MLREIKREQLTFDYLFHANNLRIVCIIEKLWLPWNSI